MPKRSDRTKKTKFRKKAIGKSERVFVRGKAGKHLCALCKKALHGVPHGKVGSKVRKLSKTKRRPTALFAGTLCTKCRSLVVEESAKVEAGAKKLDAVELRLLKYVKQVKVF